MLCDFHYGQNLMYDGKRVKIINRTEESIQGDKIRIIEDENPTNNPAVRANERHNDTTAAADYERLKIREGERIRDE